jgi:hypothetical protein
MSRWRSLFPGSSLLHRREIEAPRPAPAAIITHEVHAWRQAAVRPCRQNTYHFNKYLLPNYMPTW